MKENHIPFRHLSNLYDNDFSTIEKREEVLSHIEGCADCSLQYSLLRSSIHLTSRLSRRVCPHSDLSLRTIQIIKVRRRRRQLYKVIPAIAASCFVVFGLAFYAAKSPIKQTADAGNSGKPNYMQNETEKVIQTIRDNEARITRIADDYIEGEISPEKYKKFRKELGFAKVIYRAATRNDQFARNSLSPQDSWRTDIEEVGSGHRSYTDNQVITTERVILFRVINR